MEARPGTKTLQILLRLLASPKRYTKRELGAFVGLTDRGAIGKHLDNIAAAGIEVSRDAHHRYYVLPQQGLKELTYLSPLSEEDKQRLKDLTRHLGTADRTAMMHKLESLFDFSALGLEALRRPELEKLDALEEAIRLRRQVVLVNYRSRSSNAEQDRRVEPFEVEPEYGTLRAFDVANQANRHFRLPRLDRVTVLDQPWSFETFHNRHPTDAFGIVMDKRELVSLTLSVGAYNTLVEQHPRARQHIRKGSKENTYTFEGKVNAKYMGLLSFILGNWRGVEVHRPEGLRQKLLAEVDDFSVQYAVPIGTIQRFPAGD